MEPPIMEHLAPDVRSRSVVVDGPGSRYGQGAGDHDQAYTFGGRPTSLRPFPFSTRQYARLLVLHSKLGEAHRIGRRRQSAFA
jgi:hypothetical protein